MGKRLGVAVLMGAAGLAAAGCATQAQTQRTEPPPVGEWDGGVRYATGYGRGWTQDVVGSSRGVHFQRVGENRWRGGGREFEVDGRFLRSGGVVVELEETAEGWRLTERGALERRDTFEGSEGPQPVKYTSPSRVTLLQRLDGDRVPDARGYVRIATFRPAETVERGPGANEALPVLYVRGAQAEGGLPWPQVGLALLELRSPGY